MIQNRMKVELVRCKEITKADQTERVNSDSESSLPLQNVFPVDKIQGEIHAASTTKGQGNFLPLCGLDEDVQGGQVPWGLYTTN